MDRMGLTHSELRAYHRTLVTPGHLRRILVEVLNMDGELLSRLTPDVVDGQLTVDVKRTPTRIATLSFLDESRSVHFEPDSPGDAPLHRKRQVRIIDARYVEALGEWVECEVITGPIWDFDRTGALVTLTIDGGERKAMGAKWKPQTFGKKQPKTDVIHSLLSDAGEARLGGIPNLGATMPERLTVLRMDPIWPRCRKLAESMDRQLFYNGSGAPVLRRLPARPLFTFDERHLLGDVTIDRNPEGVFNTFVVVGAKPKGSKRRVRAVESLPNAHPLSSAALGANGERHYLVKQEENRQIKTRAEARARAERLRDDASKVIVDYSFDTIPVPHLQENDLVKVVTDGGTLRLRMRAWTLPFGYEGAPAMSVGSVKRTTTSRRGR